MECKGSASGVKVERKWSGVEWSESGVERGGAEWSGGKRGKVEYMSYFCFVVSVRLVLFLSNSAISLSFSLIVTSSFSFTWPSSALYLCASS